MRKFILNQSLVKTKLPTKKINSIANEFESGSLSVKLFRAIAENPRLTALEIKSKTRCRSPRGLIAGVINPRLKAHSLMLTHETLPGERLPRWSVFKIKEEVSSDVS